MNEVYKETIIKTILNWSEFGGVLYVTKKEIGYTLGYLSVYFILSDANDDLTITLGVNDEIQMLLGQDLLKDFQPITIRLESLSQLYGILNEIDNALKVTYETINDAFETYLEKVKDSLTLAKIDFQDLLKNK